MIRGGTWLGEIFAVAGVDGFECARAWGSLTCPMWWTIYISARRQISVSRLTYGGMLLQNGVRVYLPKCFCRICSAILENDGWPPRMVVQEPSGVVYLTVDNDPTGITGSMFQDFRSIHCGSVRTRALIDFILSTPIYILLRRRRSCVVRMSR